MGTRSRPTIYSNIYCINCKMCINKLPKYHVALLDARIIGVISGWNHTQIKVEDEYICEGCRDLAILDVNKILQQSSSGSGSSGSADQHPGPSRQGQVCLLCGTSVIRRQSSLIMQNYSSHLHQVMVEIVQSRIAPKQILKTDRVCHPCWLRTQREAQRTKRIDRFYQGRDCDRDEPAEKQPKPATPEPQQLPEYLCLSQTIDLPHYRTATDISNKCVFPSCTNTNLHNIADGLRISVLKYHQFYLPIRAQVCTDHMLSHSWRNLYNSVNSSKKFTVQQIEHVFSLVNEHFH